MILTRSRLSAFTRSRVLVVERPTAPHVRTRARSGARAGRARIALGTGTGLFLALSLALAAAAETVKPEWRDPEYGHRLRQARRWQAERPERPLVLALGSSRVQMGVSPEAMGFADEPGAPLVYNFGYRAGSPMVSGLLLARALDAGVRPRAVLLVIGFNETRLSMPAEVQFRPWRSRLSGTDLRRLAPYTASPGALRRSVWATRCNPLMAHWGPLVSDLMPGSRIALDRSESWSWETMDPHGFVRIPPEIEAEQARRPLTAQTAELVRSSDEEPVGWASDRAVRDLVARCRAEGIAVAVAWAPESPGLRSLYAPTTWAGAADFTRTLTDELGVTVFPAPEHLDEADFVDGYHLTPDGAAKYSRWLADAHLRSWLAGLPE